MPLRDALLFVWWPVAYLAVLGAVVRDWNRRDPLPVPVTAEVSIAAVSGAVAALAGLVAAIGAALIGGRRLFGK